MATTAPSLEKLYDTISKLREIVGKMDTCTQIELNRYEDKIRNEFQVIEGAIAYIGRDIYEIAQKRRNVLRSENLANIKRITKEAIDGIGDSGTSGNTGDGDRTDEPSRAKLKSNKQTSKTARQPRRKK